MIRLARHLLGLGLALALAACSADQGPTEHKTTPPPRPAGGRVVAVGADLGAAVAEAAAGDVLILAAGRHLGPVRIDTAVTIWGPRDAVVATPGSGSTIEVRAPGTRLLGFTVEGSGTRFDLLDSAVHVSSTDVEIDGLSVRGALFGILVEKSERVAVRRCEVRGSGRPAMGLRGDGIRLWETTDSVVEGNVVTDCRDCVVWYSSRNRVIGNRVERSRYGTHFMYCHDNVVADNTYVDDVVGIFVMYSRDLIIRRNLLAGASGAAGIGIGFKESGNIQVVENEIVANTTGIYSDNSPLDIAHVNRFVRNRIRKSDTAVSFHSAPHRVELLENDLRDNVHQARVGGAGDALDATWRNNHFDDYQGYDLDGDGLGDLPYVLRSLSSQLQSRYPDLAFFRGTPVLAVTDLVGHIVPLFSPRTILEDPSPRMHSIHDGTELSHAR